MEKMGGKQGGIMLESYFHLYKKDDMLPVNKSNGIYL